MTERPVAAFAERRLLGVVELKSGPTSVRKAVSGSFVEESVKACAAIFKNDEFDEKEAIT